MTAAAYRKRPTLIASQINRADHICNIITPANETRSFVNHCVVYLACFVVTVIGWTEKITPETCYILFIRLLSKICHDSLLLFI
jgi:hypothetical protein